MTLQGEIERVTFENEETGFRVLRLGGVRGLQGKNRLTVVGVLPPVGPGTRVRVTGELQKDAKHGDQMRAESLVVVAPETQEEVEKYLSSGVIKGVGPSFAKRIVRFFGLETLAVLDQESHRLSEVPGLGQARVEKIRSAWLEHRQLSNVMLALTGHGASPSLAARILARFGEKAAEIVQQNPYRLAIEIRGVGFRTADSIATQQGLSPDHPERIHAGLLHQLQEMESSGHCYCPRSLLEQRTAEMLAIDVPHVSAGIDKLWAANKLVLDGDNVFLQRLYEAEVSVAEDLVRLLQSPLKKLPRAEAALARFEKSKGFELAQKQREAVAAAVSQKVVVITGGPGVGKTTIVQAILHVLKEAKLRTALAAPTGRAAKRLAESTGREASTIHRLLEVNAHTGQFERDAESPLEFDLLIVDEASMIDLRLGASLLAAIGDAARLVLVGDVDQLPSVGAGAVLGDIISSGKVPVARLDVIFRQGETSRIIQASHQIQSGEMPEGGAAPDSDFFVIKAGRPERARDVVLQAVAERIPQRFGLDPRREIQVLTPMHRGEAGTIELNRRLQNQLNPGSVALKVGETDFRPGDKVLQTKNDYDRGVFNGDVGRVLDVDLEAGQLTASFEDDGRSRPVVYERSELIQLQLAYAMSIHKSQGSEYPGVVIPFLTSHFVMLSRNLLYTAVTRARRLCVLVADPRAIKLALAETRKEERLTRLSERLAEALDD